MAIAFNVEPYWDDFESVGADGLSPKEKYQRILFRPGKAVQARELTQLQSALQNQISSTGDHIFKDGSVVVPGAVHLHNKIDYVRLSAALTGVEASTVADLVGTEFTETGTSVVGKVIHAALAEGDDSITIWVQYISGDTFTAGGALTATGKTATISSTNDVNANAPIGFGSIVSIENGIYYIKKHFVVVKAKTIELSKYTYNVSFDIGLLVTESLVSSGTDASLNDNATGSPNESAPGAHRYSITAALSTQAVNATLGNFVLIARLESGVITKNARTADYNHLADELARRTFDESGNYYVNPFQASTKVHASDSEKLTLGVEPSKAYVRGYEIQTLGTTNVHFDRARTSERVTDKVTEISHNNYIEVDNMACTPDITTFGRIKLTDGSGGDIVAYARARSVERVSGNGATTASRYRIHLFDYDQQHATKTMTNASHVAIFDNTTPAADFAAEILSYNLGPDSLVYKLPYDRVKTCNSEVDPGQPADYNYRYETNRIVGSATVNSNSASFTTTVTNEQYGTYGANTNWILINDTANTVGGEEVLVGDIVISNNYQTATINNLPGGIDGDTVRLIAPMVRTLDHKTKTLITNQSTPFSAVDWTGIGQELGHADIYRIVSVTETSGGTDVTEHFDLDNGQRDTHYDMGRVSLKTTSNYTAAVALTVKYDYFSHSAGDFFTVDSYTGQIDYCNIPTHNGIELRSAVDFRPRMKNGGVGFDGTGASTSFCPMRYTQFETDIQFYLPRIDKVYLDSKGEFGVSPGVPARVPEKPGVPKDSMHLYTLSIPAYTCLPGEVDIEFIDNRRYTMRDIGTIEKRLNQVEYYSVLSFLENEAQNKQILDDNLNPRWKAGYLVDGFANTRMSKSDSSEYRASVDIPNRTLRPPFSQGNAAFEYVSGSSGTVKTGDLVTLPYTEASIISQTQHSGQINVNPYDVFNWTGSMTLTPSTDEWRDVDRRPEVVINNDGQFDAMMNNLEPQVGTNWGSWSTNWSGSQSWQDTGQWQQSLIQTGTRTRTGIQQTIETQTSRVNVGDRIVEVNFIPFMRTRLVAFSATRLKPATQVYAFFDDVSVADYVSTNASSYDPLVGVNTVVAHPATATTLTTDANGAISGTFLVPNNSTLNFSTGEKEFKLTQSSVNNDEITTTSATAPYTAAGLIDTVENVVLSTRTPLIQRNSVSESVGDSRTLRTRSTRPPPVEWSDPLAQSILLDQATFITSLDLYFTQKDSAIPVQVQIRKMVNGYPTQEVVPFSDVTLNPGSVSTSAATTFTFPSPVFLQNGIEYAIVIMANSNNYLIRYAEIGAEDQAGNRISQQPYNGVLFMSQNASTWTPDQNKDLMFVLNRAVFDTTTRTCVLRDATLPSRQLVNHPFTTDATTTVSVAHRDHGMSIGDTTTIAGAIATNGITAAQLNTTHTLTAVTRDTYEFVAGGSASTSGNGGGADCQATQHLAWNTMHPIIQEIILPDTTLTWTVQDSLESTGTITSTAAAITVNEDYTPLLPKIIKSGVGYTLQLNGTFTSTSDYLSPVIDLERCSVITVSNRVDNVTSGETNASTGANLAKYVTKSVELNDTSDGIKIWLDINRPNNTFVDLYYRTGNTASSFDTQSWIAAASTPTSVAYSDGTTYEETIYDITPAATFTIFQLKIVMRSTSTSSIPKCQGLRAIALKA